MTKVILAVLMLTILSSGMLLSYVAHSPRTVLDANGNPAGSR